MSLRRLRSITAAAVLSLAPLAGGVFAPTAVQARPASPYAALDRQEQKDLEVLRRAETEAARTGYAGLARHARALEAALDRAPSTYPKREVRPDLVIVRGSNDVGEVVTSLLGEAASAMQAGAPARSEARRNVYPTIAFLLGSLYVEARQPDRALAAIEKGLRLQPNDPPLINEKAVVLSQQGRNAEALAALDGALASDELGLLPHRSRLLRARGFQLIELGRLDEAQATYEEALKLEPEHAGAKGQLEYIAALRSGGQRREPSYVAPLAATPPTRE